VVGTATIDGASAATTKRVVGARPLDVLLATIVTAPPVALAGIRSWELNWPRAFVAAVAVRVCLVPLESGTVALMETVSPARYPFPLTVTVDPGMADAGDAVIVATIRLTRSGALVCVFGPCAVTVT
jgi:hypothetical protein